MNSNSSKKYKIIFSVSFLIVVIIMILFFDFGLTFNNDAEQNGTNKEVISNEVEIKKDNDENIEDNIDKKYEDKDKIFEFEDIYDDMVTISNENLERAMNLFDGVKFRVRAKADKCFTVYDAPYLKYIIDNDDTSISANSEVKYISGQINFIGELRDTKESLRYITKEYFSIELEKVINFDSSDFKYQYKDYREEVSYLYADKEIKKGYQDFIYKFNVDYTYDINLIRLDENLEPYNFTNDIPDVFDDKLKKIGEDKDIGIGDNVKFGKKRYKVIAVDEEDENKVLLMYDTHITDQMGIIYEIPDNSKLSKINWSDNEECIYRDSKIREYLTKDYYENNISNADKARIYTTKLECKVKNAKKVNEIDYVEDKIFILSDDEIKKYKLFLVNPLLTSFVRNQRYGEKSASMYRRSKILNDEYDQNTFNLKDTWSIYPAMWVNIK